MVASKVINLAYLSHISRIALSFNFFLHICMFLGDTTNGFSSMHIGALQLKLKKFLALSE